MSNTTLSDLIGNTDIYIVDQIMKNRYQHNDRILDAGCAEGRNLVWFYTNNIDISGIDNDPERLKVAQERYPNAAANFQVASIEELPYTNEYFDHIICCAVLHFAQSDSHFFEMLTELLRVLKVNGSLFIRVASHIGLDGNVPYLKESKTNREGSFFISRTIIKSILKQFSVELIDPVKTTNVNDERAMTTIVLRKL